MFNKILIANRGEIACRIIKTAKSMGVLTVAIYSDADKNALHVQMADEAIYIGPSPSRESYLLGDNVIAAAIQTGAQAIHPGYGFLSENADFCRSCAKQNITFIGPPVAAIEAMGSKSAAKNIMEKANVPLVPGYHGDDQSNEVIKKAADDMGYPVLLKATAGGGGKGMRQVWNEQEFAEGLAAAKREAMSSFGDDTMLVEKYLTQPRHVEIQVFCDNHNNAVYLFERDCSVQRRHQKVIEEAPAFGMSEELRAQMGESAIKSAQAIGYQGAGTVEFLLDVDGSFYFMEMNTRLQVEHPVTEMISGQDLVEWQLRVAAGEILPKTQEQLVLNGHAFEARIYAEDPNKDFLPATGKLSLLQTPVESKHVRIDTGVRQGDEVSVYYDPMIAKLIVWDENREKALTRLSKALSEYRINGVTTNIDFLYNLATSQPFIDEEIDTSFIEKNNELIFKNKQQLLQNELPIAALYLILTRQHKTQKDALKSSDSNSPWHNANAWRLNEPYIHSFVLAHNETEYNVEIEQKNHGSDVNYSLNVNGKQFNCQGSLNNDLLITTINGHRSTTTVSLINNNINLYRENGVFNFIHILPDCGQHDNENGHGGLTAPMNGTMISVLVKAGDTVSKNQPLVIMEAMKMEHTIKAPSDGIINEIFFQAGDMVDGGAELLAFSEQINVNDEA
ncbi:acetyl/propionyl/methylcrotonyl-CoA carboxylase subunit alpha [Colwellia sp. 1_MG-2023]|uniref:acetyl/propionyl/methylcrotonyl-CoA carboxylase subunit alpha n=1 Tax=unclassified Colwellia TaxID=196834 RepID=UPI001C09FFA0|nr:MULTISPECIES: acetyl/propionyl/methylcrotonyl-CoA carboxylase subunit alpha [unclassified Colwellia]MBU2924615.1 acetyl/propionyl/methylcrotonyl-CoA carboxylase subunit alpha [Colwellia sp. C2M11]MDO6654144.1 acetyl/propionyl/methylcrotonyl-CoA carboxylase subunit alpha [Colwellia sp. 3_MG-2023]MDO6667193.1 acetyl/propionyl/methylcrotonyl-CoA carboxylase subunit alpha [Colwellia sp. 2_MG-2023]MDO6691548.1 acetyl/propionyl/methylcrotonyl-CoA carboxylase subunit alpha [Colwellia sp. 1_MG-2023]